MRELGRIPQLLEAIAELALTLVLIRNARNELIHPLKRNISLSIDFNKKPFAILKK